MSNLKITLDKLKKARKEVSDSACALFALSVATAIPISMVVMGGKHQKDCPAEDMIAKFLISFGVLLMVRNIYSIIIRIDRYRGEREGIEMVIVYIYDFFLYAWFIAGNVYIYRLRGDFQSHDSKAEDFCNYAIYWYAFWIITICHILPLGVSLVVLIHYCMKN